LQPIEEKYRTDDKTNITLTVSLEKIEGDKEKVIEKVKGVGDKLKDKTVAPTDKTKKEEGARS
jgi:hypothetical protein